jgi:hypothetical protein
MAMALATTLANVSVTQAGQVETVLLCSCALTQHAQDMVNARTGSAIASQALKAQFASHLETAIHLVHQMASVIQHPISASAKKASQAQIAALELMSARMAAMVAVCASMGIVCVAQDGMGLPAKNGTWSLGLPLRLLTKRHSRQGGTQVEQMTKKVNRRLSPLVAEVKQQLQQLQRQLRMLAWVLPVEKAALALGMASATQLRESATATLALME